MIVEGEKAAAAQAGGLRLDQGQHQLRGDGGIGGAAAGGDHVGAGFARQRIGGHHHVFMGDDFLFGELLRFTLGVGDRAGRSGEGGKSG